ncbi:MAG: lysostaphin resistance A-like protein [Candidatus Berkiella sp.]
MIFSYNAIFQNHLTLAVFGCLWFTFIFMYLVKNNLARFSAFLVSLLLGIVVGHIEPIGFGLIALFGLLFYISYQANNKWLRKGAFLIVLAGAIAIMLMPVPGMNNWHPITRLYITDDAIPYSMHFTFDKSLIGLFFIWFSAYSLANEGHWKNVLKTGFLCGLVAVAILLPLSLGLGYVKFDPKFNRFFFLWALNNLFFVSIAEEALFRGMIMQSLMNLWQNYRIGKWLALIISASLFGLAHYKGGSKYMLLAGVAGILYGYAYMRTRKVEASVLTHFMVNSIHFVFFTYPALASAFE